MTCTLWSPCNPCVSTQMGGITVGYKTIIHSTQFKQDKVHRSDSPHCKPTQSSSEILPVFSLYCFHRNGWNHSGVRNSNPFHSVLLPTGMGGKLKTPSSCSFMWCTQWKIWNLVVLNIFLLLSQDHVSDLSEWIIEFSGADLELLVTLDFRNIHYTKT